MTKLGRLVATILVGAALLTGCSERETGEVAQNTVESSGPKNVVLICMDAVRADTWFQIAALADDRFSRWEKKALVYTHAQAPSPWTVPSVASVFTGLLPAHHGAGMFPGAYAMLHEQTPSPMRGDVPTIASEALAAGYDTGVLSASAWTNGVIGLRHLMDGFTELTAFDTPGSEADWAPMLETWRENDLKRAEGKNFLHFLHLMEAHNWHATLDKSMKEIYDSITEEQRQEYSTMLPPNICDDPNNSLCHSFYVYAHAVRYTREGVAEVLETLQRQNLLDDTIVVLFGDHGEEFLDHFGDLRQGENEDVIKSLFEAYGHGKSLYQELLNVPLLVWHPDYDGASIDAPVSILDIAPSTMQWLGFAQDKPAWQGQNLALASAGDAEERTFIGSMLASGEQQLSAIRGDKKAIWFLVSDHIDYYDLAADPGETTPLQDDKLVLQFDGLFLDYMEAVPKKEIEKSSKLSKEQIRRLQSIGYLQGVDEEESEEPAEEQ